VSPPENHNRANFELHGFLIMRKFSRRVLLVLGWYDYRLHRGIERYAQEHGWQLSEDLAREKVIPWGWEGDGILAWLGAGDDLAEFVFHSQKPTVDFSFRRPQLKFTRVLEDTTGAAQLVADHFLSRGFRNFLFYSDAENWVYNERGKAFQEILKRAGHNARWLRWHESPAYRADRKAWKIKREWLGAEMERAEKPVGIFAASDGLALEVLETCENAGIGVPEGVAIVGAGNSLLAVDAMTTPISSVDTNLETLGYRGAHQLDRLMQRRAAPAAAIRVPPFRLIIRKSSDLMAVRHPGIARSLRFLWEHCHEPIGVEDLARAASMSMRSFHEAFVQHLGRSPGAEIHRIRIEYAKRLLLESDDKMVVIAEKCGYQSSNSLWVAFKHATGMSPKKYRTKWAAAASSSRTEGQA
jgi:LacI family transcriptional regulator